jgi:hypothetical protein
MLLCNVEVVDVQSEGRNWKSSGVTAAVAISLSLQVATAGITESMFHVEAGVAGSIL